MILADPVCRALLRPDLDKRLILDLILGCGLNPRMQTLVRLIERDTPTDGLHERLYERR